MDITFVKKKLFGRKVGNVEDSKSQYVTLEDFLRLPVICYRLMGVDPLESNKKTSIALHLLFAFQMVSLIFAISMQIEQVRLNEDFLESVQVLAYSTFGTAGVLKTASVQLQKDKMIILVSQLRSCFPSPTDEKQKQYEVKHYLRRYSRIAKAFLGFFLFVITMFVVAAFGQYVIQRWVLRSSSPTQSLPFVSMLPWKWRDSWRYYPSYLLQSIHGFTAAGNHIAGDTMIFAVVMQVIMHFDRLTRALREFKVYNNGVGARTEENLKNLRALITYHNQVLGLPDVLNEIFGIPLLLNFLAFSLLVCNLSFQLTLGFSSDHVGLQFLFLTSALMEIYLICFFSQMLIDASENVSFAACDMNWTEADSRFRKMLLFICLRAQKPVCLKATVFFDISIETMSIFLRVSYKFLCIIRSMYQ